MVFWSYGCLQPLPPTTDTHIRVYVQRKILPWRAGWRGTGKLLSLSPYQQAATLPGVDQGWSMQHNGSNSESLGEWVPAYCASYPFYLWKIPTDFTDVNIYHKDQMKAVERYLSNLHVTKISFFPWIDAAVCLITREKTCFAQIRWAHHFLSTSLASFSREILSSHPSQAF